MCQTFVLDIHAGCHVCICGQAPSPPYFLHSQKQPSSPDVTTILPLYPRPLPQSLVVLAKIWPFYSVSRDLHTCNQIYWSSFSIRSLIRLWTRVVHSVTGYLTLHGGTDTLPNALHLCRRLHLHTSDNVLRQRLQHGDILHVSWLAFSVSRTIIISPQSVTLLLSTYMASSLWVVFHWR